MREKVNLPLTPLKNPTDHLRTQKFFYIKSKNIGEWGLMKLGKGKGGYGYEKMDFNFFVVS